MHRPVVQSSVLYARRTFKISVADPGDFVSTDTEYVGVPPARAFPYCLDFLRARAIYVRGIDPRAVQAAPFYYLHLRRRAREIFSVPIEEAPIVDNDPARDPIFLFSPGRCGSTLLSRILFEAGVTSVSEPDFYTQMASRFWSSPLNPTRSAYLRAMWNLSNDLTVALGDVAVVKLRAECARTPELFIRNSSARSLVMFRRFEDWARSTTRVFGTGPHKAVGKYLTALRCYATLRRRSLCHVLRYEDCMADPVAFSASLGQFLGREISPEAVARASKNDSQGGTPLSRCAKRAWEVKFDATMRLWNAPRLVSARQRLDVPNVWD